MQGRSAVFAMHLRSRLGVARRHPAHTTDETQDLTLQFTVRQCPERPQQLQLRPYELALIAVARGWRVESLEEELQRLSEQTGRLQQSAGANADFTTLVLLY